MTFFNFTGLKRGALHVTDSDTLHIHNCSFISNQADLGGAIYSQYNRHNTINNSAFNYNRGNFIGGSLLFDSSDHVIIKNSAFNWNEAVSYGGAVSINQINKLLDISGCYFHNNSAIIGSTFVIARSSDSYISFNEFAENTAGRGTIFWLRSTMSVAPQFIQNKFTNNEVKFYGKEIATECTRLITENSAYDQLVNSYLLGEEFFKPISLRLVDFYGQTVTFESGTVAYTYFTFDNNKVDCGSNTPLFFGNHIGKSLKGEILLSNFGAHCIPGGSLSFLIGVRVSTSVTNFPAYNVKPNVRELSTNTLANSHERMEYMYEPKFRDEAGWLEISSSYEVNYRRCRVGEIYDVASPQKSKCFECYGAVSLLPNLYNEITECIPCPPLASTCFSNQIILPINTWRLDPLSLDVFPCPYRLSCKGGNETGDESCAPGYMGVVCGTCQAGYNFNGIVCIPCISGSKSGFFTPVKLFFFGGLLGIIILALYIFIRRMTKYEKARLLLMMGVGTKVNLDLILERSSPAEKAKYADEKYKVKKKKSNNLMGKVKILTSSLQIIAASSANLNVQFPDVLQNWFKIGKITNFDFRELLDTGIVILFISF